MKAITMRRRVKRLNKLGFILLIILFSSRGGIYAQLDSNAFWKDIPLVRESGVPLGGIGAGKVDLCPDGAFRNMTFQNSVDVPVSGYKSDEFTNEGIPEAFFAIAVEGTGAKMLKVNSKKGVPDGDKIEDIRYKGLYPFVNIEFPDFGEMAVELEAFSPILLDDPHPEYLNSSLPAFIATLKITNKSNQPKKVGALFSFPNIIGNGGYPKTRMHDPRGNEMYANKDENGASILYTHTRPKMDPRLEGQMHLTALPSDNTKLTTEVNYWWGHRFENFGKTCDLPGTVAKEVLTVIGAVKQGSMGAVAGTKMVDPGETFEQKFILSWYFPNRKTNDSPEVIDTNFYAKHFDSVQAVTKYVEENAEMLYEGTKRWQQRFEDSNLPDWFNVKLINNISTLSANTLYLSDGRFGINESPSIMRGCMGTIDQRAASHSIYTFAFPKLAKSELTLFNETQIMENSEDRYSPHWNIKTGKFDMKLDRLGAVRHDFGRDDFEGGMGPSNHWKTTHWPDIGSVYVLQSYAQAAWTNDMDYLKEVYPRMLSTLEFQKRLDQDKNGIADLWGHGSCTYDGRSFHHYGNTPFVATLHLAAIRAAQKTAKILGDDERIDMLQKDFDKNRRSLDSLLWNEEVGQYDKYVNSYYAVCNGTDKEHNERSTNRFISQIAGNWFVNQLNLENILDADRIDTVLDGLYKHNVAAVEYAAYTEIGPDRHKTFKLQSWPYYVETYYAANAIYEGKVDEGMDMEKRFANAMFEKTGRLWDVSLRFAGEENGESGWGRWYMSTPSSWFVLQALAGVHYDGLTQTLIVNPAQWSELENFDKIPVFHPLFWATISKDKKGWALDIDKVLDPKNPIVIKELIISNEIDGKFYINSKVLKSRKKGVKNKKSVYQTDVVIENPAVLLFKS